MARYLRTATWIAITAFLLLWLVGILQGQPSGVDKRLWQDFEAEHSRAVSSASFKAWMAGQVECESSWRGCPESPAGAKGPCQFIDSTVDWVFPAVGCAGEDACNARCSFRGQIYLVKWRLKHRSNFTPEDQMAVALADYNGGWGNVTKERAICVRRPGCNPNRWYGHVETIRGVRSDANFKENRDYPKKVTKARKRYL